MKISLMAAITVDGFIGQSTDQTSIEWTSSADKKIFVQKTKEAGVIIMGRTTFDTIGRALPKRLNYILTRSPEKYADTVEDGVLEFHTKSPAEVVADLAARGYTHAILCGGAKTYADFLQAGVVDELLLTVEPKLFGAGVPLLGDWATHLDLKLESSERIGNDSLFLTYNIT